VVAIDWALVAVLALSTVVSLFRGFFKEAISVCTWVAAVWAAWKFGPQLAGGLTEWLSTSVLRLWAARAIILIGVLFVGGMLNWLFGMLLHRTGLSGTDRVIGMVFGAGRGVILIGLIIVILELMGFNETPWWQESKLIPYAAPVVDTIRHAAEDGREFLSDLDEAEGSTDAADRQPTAGPPAAPDKPAE
jgi:membrane protein required for colicin V production